MWRVCACASCVYEEPIWLVPKPTSVCWRYLSSELRIYANHTSGVSSIKRRFYLKGGGGGKGGGRLMHRIGKRAGYIYKTLSSFAIHLSHRNCDRAKMLTTLAVISKYRRFTTSIHILKSTLDILWGIEISSNVGKKKTTLLFSGSERENYRRKWRIGRHERIGTEWSFLLRNVAISSWSIGYFGKLRICKRQNELVGRVITNAIH